jgi:sigma-B regulation protein RsbU (phosphoserine phosphatase)
MSFAMQLLITPLSFIMPFYISIIYQHEYINIDKSLKQSFIKRQSDLLELITEISKKNNDEINISEISNFIVSTASKNTNSNNGALFLIDSVEDRLELKAVTGKIEDVFADFEKFKISYNFNNKLLKSKNNSLTEIIFIETVLKTNPLLFRDLKKIKSNSGENHSLYINSLIAVPLKSGSHFLGLIILLKNKAYDYFTDLDFDYMKSFAEFISIKLESVFKDMNSHHNHFIENQQAVTAEIQKLIMPKKMPIYKDVELAAFTLPVKGTGGDFYDIVSINEEVFGIIISDIASKGITAIIAKIMIKSIFNLISFQTKNPASILKLISKGITNTFNFDCFATALYAVYDRHKKEIIYSNASHPPLLVYRKSKTAFLNIKPEGLPLGIDKHASYIQNRIVLQKGDMVFFYTDGITESTDEKNNQYPISRIQKILNKFCEETADNICIKIQNDLRNYSKNNRQNDDITAVIMKIK